MRRKTMMSLFLVFGLAASLPSMRGAESSGSLTGVVRNASGKPVAGAMVKVRNSDRGVTFTVISQGQGRYRASNLPAGKYTVQGLGGGLQNDPQLTVEVVGSQTVTG